MRIQRIELNGFKSFSDRTRLDLHPGITCVVGPNGCGKSNVVDAFRWALGEQSAKNLRGSKMEEVIFSGTDQRKPKGMSQVDIVLGGVLTETPEGMPTDSIMVSRRLFRTGESEYLINRNPCRLRDIRDIFLDTGLELKTYSILEQGRVGEIVSAKPADRRFLIEEVAGVVKYKVRKQEALSKLESARSNLQRVSDIIGEVKRQLNALDRQARKAERYKKMLEEARELDLAVSSQEYRTHAAAIEGLARQIASFREEEAGRVMELERIETGIEEKRILLAEQEKEVQENQGRLYEQEKLNTELQGRIDLLRQEIENLHNRIADHERREGDLRERTTGLREQESEASRKAEELGLSVSDARQRLEAIEERVRQAEGSLRSLEERLEQARREAMAVADEKGRLENRIAVLERDRENLMARLRRAEDERTTVLSERARRAEEMNAAENALLASRTLLGDRQLEREQVLKRLQETRDRLRRAEEEARASREEAVAAATRLASLEELEKELAGFGEGTQRIAEKGRETFGIDVVGFLADRVRVRPEYEAAVEAALGDRLRTLLVRDTASVRSALQTLESLDLGGGAFIASDVLAAGGGTETKPLPAGAGIHGWLHQFLDPVDESASVYARLFQNVLVVQDRERALQLWDLRNGEPGLTLVTLAGEIFEATGVVLSARGKGLLGKKREIRDLRRGAEEARSRAERQDADVVGLKKQMGDEEEELERTSMVLREGERQTDEAERRYETLKQELARSDQRLGHLEGEEQQGRAELSSLDGEISDRQTELATVEATRVKVDADIGVTREERAAARDHLDGIRAEGTEVRVDYNRVQSELAGNARERERIAQSIADVLGRRETLAGEREEMEGKVLSADSERQRAEEERSGGVTRVHQHEEELQKARVRYNEQFEAVKEMEREAKTRRPVLEDVRERLKEAEVGRAERAAKLEALVAKILDDYDVRIQEVPSAELPEGAEERLLDLRRKMGSMGPVSLGALEEYQELEERHGFLHKQQEDLMESIESLDAAISKINQTTKRRLTEAYGKLREKFQEVFRTLFGGGRADLVLVGDDILEAGLDVQAQPPGKRLQNITLLSGGEKALTALSILFAGFLIKPSPLCILDEVDAPLDESNTDRFAILLKEIAKDVQFIVITHNRRTMEAADVLYGATMEEPGVTKIVSMKMAEYAGG